MRDIVERLWESDEASALTNEAAREIERLRSSLSTARSEGIREGLEMAEKVAEEKGVEWENDAKLWQKEGMHKTAAAALCHSEAAAQIAAAIRAKIEETRALAEHEEAGW